jgi:hypothetical protein
MWNDIRCSKRLIGSVCIWHSILSLCGRQKMSLEHPDLIVDEIGAPCNVMALHGISCLDRKAMAAWVSEIWDSLIKHSLHVKCVHSCWKLSTTPRYPYLIQCSQAMHGSSTWHAIEYGLELLKKGTIWRVGNGSKIRACMAPMDSLRSWLSPPLTTGPLLIMLGLNLGMILNLPQTSTRPHEYLISPRTEPNLFYIYVRSTITKPTPFSTQTKLNLSA